MSKEAFFPQAIFTPQPEQAQTRVFCSPGKYVQGPGVLGQIGKYLQPYGFTNVGLLASPGRHANEGLAVTQSLVDAGAASCPVTFRGECSLEEIDRLTAELRRQNVAALVVLGGGKCVDTGKCVAYRLDVPVVVAPTLASNDAPCSALSVLYTPEGVSQGVEFFPDNPLLVVVDTAVVAGASERYLVAGMGDAMSTWYEVKVCENNPLASNVMGARPTLAALAIGEVCARTLFSDGVSAAAAVRKSECTQALERVVEANTLLSGIGFESGGLAAAHGVAQGYTVIPEVEHNYLHGEMVAMGVLTQLALEQDKVELQKAAKFFAEIGLPIHLKQLGLDRSQSEKLNQLTEATSDFVYLENLPFAVTSDMISQAILDADAIGSEIAQSLGDTAYQRLHA